MKATITVLPGDGIGPEVAAEGVRVLRAVEEAWGHAFEIHEALIGGCAIDATGSPLPDQTLQFCWGSDAVLLGAVGGPKWDDPQASTRPEQGLLGIRKALGLYANLRPVHVHPQLVDASPLRPERLEGVNLLVVRELTGGIYFGAKQREAYPDGGERASDLCEYSSEEIERVVRTAAALARSRRGKLTSVDKANVLETSRLWRSVTSRVMNDEFPDVALEHVLVDACAMHLLRRPGDFDVIVTENMFGDILTDEASMLAGSMGLLPSASLGAPQPGKASQMGLYEPIHGSAPDIAGHGVANPIGTILSVALLLRHSLRLEEEADAVEAAVEAVLADGLRTMDIARLGGPWVGTATMGAAVTAAIRHRAAARAAVQS